MAATLTQERFDGPEWLATVGELWAELPARPLGLGEAIERLKRMTA